MKTERALYKWDCSRTLLLIAVGFATCAAPIAHGQSSPSPSQSTPQAASAPAAPPAYVFDVASTKADESVSRVMMIRPTKTGISASGVSLQMLIRVAYSVRDFQISGGSAWLSSNRYDIEVKVGDATAAELEKLDTTQRNLADRQMVQALLADRFKLALHHETQELSEYVLVVAKSGPRLQETKPHDTYPSGFAGPDGRGIDGMLGGAPGRFTGQAVNLETLAFALSMQLGVPVVDKTGLTGRYDVTLKWAPGASQSPMVGGAGAAPQGPGAPPPPPPDTSAPSLFTAIEEQLGLELELQKGPVDVLVIDHIEPASEN
jgi:uncharacterized protein (TIGR03435 family)